jgi:antitoxin HigA-1
MADDRKSERNSGRNSEQITSRCSGEMARGPATAMKTFAFHPGDILKTEFMEPLGLSAWRLARELEVPAPRINDIVRGKRGVSANTALRLGLYFGNSAQFWLNLQNRYDLAEAAKDRSIRKIRSRTAA